MWCISGQGLIKQQNQPFQRRMVMTVSMVVPSLPVVMKDKWNNSRNIHYHTFYQDFFGPTYFYSQLHRHGGSFADSILFYKAVQEVDKGASFYFLVCMYT